MAEFVLILLKRNKWTLLELPQRYGERTVHAEGGAVSIKYRRYPRTEITDKRNHITSLTLVMKIRLHGLSSISITLVETTVLPYKSI